MKRIYTLFLLFIVSIGFSQVFWTENFGVGCNQLQLANGVPASPGPGFWTVTNTIASTTGSDEFYISATEAGMGVGNCGNGCLASGGTNQTLHICNSSSGTAFVCTTGDCGALYNAGIASDIRAESPSINCTGRNTIILSFSYLEFGQAGLDFAQVLYRIGAGPWTVLSGLAQTTCGNL
ncbi:MAG: hypothetical protein ACXVPD_13750, partial [Bacteroidia bacterium]